jgi:NTE family protein
MVQRALVLGGGGPVGIAWEAGLLAGLAEGGVELGQADLIIGTSAGSYVGSQLANGRTAGALTDTILAEAQKAKASAGEKASAAATPPNLTPLFRKMQEVSEGIRDQREVLREIGQISLGAATIDEASFIRSFGRSLSELPEDFWPKRRFACTAVDAESGEFKLWTRESKVGLARAVASSCSVPGVFPAVTINGRRYMDGGMRSTTNADMAKGAAFTVVVAVRVALAGERLMRVVENELAILREGGGRAELVTPDAASAEAFGVNLMDPKRRPGACMAGMAQGRAIAAQLKSIWG